MLWQSEGGYTDYVNHKKERLGDYGAAEVQSTSGGPITVHGVLGQGAADQNDAGTPAQNKSNWKAGQRKKLKFTWQEQKDYETIEGVIASLEEKIESLEAEIPKHSRDFVKLNDLMKQKEECEELLEEKMERWMYLEDLAARIEAGEEA